MPTISTATNQQIESLVSQYRYSISNPVTILQNKQTSLNARLTVLADLKSKMSSLNRLSKELKGAGGLSKFNTNAFESSLPGVATGTASSTASTGSHSLLVTQLAKADKVISSQLSSTSTSIATTEGVGTKSINISVNGTSVAVNVAIAEGDSNSTVLGNLAAAVNASDSNVRASVVSDTSGTSRLVFTSKQTGLAQAVSLADVSGTLLDSIGLGASVVSNRTSSTSTGGGYLYSSDSLDAEFQLDGIDITRGTNSITDVLSGVTLELKSVQDPSDTPLTLNITSDKSAVKTKVEEFLKAYNEVISFLNAKTSVDPGKGSREILAGDQVFRRLRLDLRSLMGSPVDSVTSGNPTLLSDIGIKAASDGTLSLSDTTAFENALSSNVNKVSDLFNTSNGVAGKLNTLLETFTTTGGQLELARNGTDNQLSNVKTALTRNNSQIDTRVASFRKQYESLYSAMTRLSLQSQSISSLFTRIYG